MTGYTVCGTCGSKDGEYVSGSHFERWFCRKCNCETNPVEKYVLSPYERTRNAVYATGNRWAIENFNATHN